MSRTLLLALAFTVACPMAAEEPVDPIQLTVADASFVADDQWAVGTEVGVLDVSVSEGAELQLTVPDGVPFAIDEAGRLVVDGPLDVTQARNHRFDVEVTAGDLQAVADVRVRVTTTTLQPSQSPALGDKTALWIRTSFDGVEGEQTEQDIADAMTSLNKYLREQSADQVRVVRWEVTPHIEVGVTRDEAPRDAFAIRTLVAQAAIDADPAYDPADYNYLFLSLPGGVDLGGAGALGTGDGNVGTAWIPAPLWVPGTVHEAFHVLGVGHCDVLMGDETYPAPPGSGGHDPFFFMGSEGSEAKEPTKGLQYDIFAAINVPMKYHMGWLREANLRDVRRAGTHRIWSSRTEQPPGLTPYALRLHVGSDTLWVSYEPTVFNSEITATGLLVHTHDDGWTRLLDHRPASVPDDPKIRQALNEVAEFSDAAIPVGETMTVGTEWTITLEAEGEEDGRYWADVRIDVP
ncbi:MAG: hypothetical protein KTR31_42015 [Myxococcales bacterium]|nr:hypothetical protein [Myxococcales bacterium]